MHVVEALSRLGGVASARTLVRATSRARVRTALTKGDIVHNGRGYALPGAEAGRRAAAALNGVMSHLTAAAHHGWELKTQPQHPTITVPRGRKVDPVRRHGVDVKWRAGVRVGDLVTDPVQTVIDCAKDLPFDEALAVADSAQRHGSVTQDELLQAAARLRGTGRRRAWRVASYADGRAANPFESVLRAIALDTLGLNVTPQLPVVDGAFYARPDLVDPELRLVIEADSFGFHSSRSALKRDCERYTGLSLRGWLVLRFSWEHVMFAPEYVAECLRAAVALQQPERRTGAPGAGRKSA